MAIKVNHKRLNWIEIAESLSKTYSQRLEIELKKIPEYDEIDFIQNELLQADAELNEPFTNESSVIWKRYKKIIENYKTFLEERKESIQTTNHNVTLDEKANQLFKKSLVLQNIWLPDARLKTKEFLQLGIEKGLWNGNMKIIVQKGERSLYGTGKVMLGCIAIAFRGWAISTHTDYKEVGRAFCEAFDIEIKNTTKEPYKSFSTGNEKYIREIKKTFGLK